MRAGMRAEIEDVEPGRSVAVCWDGETIEDTIAFHVIEPPGSVSFERDPETDRLAITLEFEYDEARPASEFEIRVDDEPADTQWDDEYETVESGATIHLEALEYGDSVDVYWRKGGPALGIESIEPRVDVEFDRQDVLVLEHEGGDSLPVEKLRVHPHGEDDEGETVPLSDVADGRFEPGDTVEIDFERDVENVSTFSLSFDGMTIAVCCLEW